MRAPSILPPYSPTFNPIERMFSVIKSYILKNTKNVELSSENIILEAIDSNKITNHIGNIEKFVYFIYDGEMFVLQ